MISLGDDCLPRDFGRNLRKLGTYLAMFVLWAEGGQIWSRGGAAVLWI